MEDVAVLALPEEVRRHELEGAGGVEAQAAHGDQEGDGHRDRQVHGEGEAEALDADLAGELSCRRGRGDDLADALRGLLRALKGRVTEAF